MKQLFTDFKPSTAADWRNQIVKDLKGEAYENLVWKNENGFDIQPFYTSETITTPYEPAFTHTGWEIGVNGRAAGAAGLNKQLLRDLANGASAIFVSCKGLDLEKALNGIQLNYIHATFFVDEAGARDLRSYLEKHYTLSELNCSLFPEKLETAADLENWQSVIRLFKEVANIRTVSLNALPFHNQNCLAYYEVAVILSGLVEYLSAGPIPAADIVVKAGVSEDYFIQIAKLRALRRLWNILKEEYKINNGLHVVVETGLTDKSISDSYNNLLRTTIEAMAAVAGGCNELIVNGFDVLFPTNATLSERMAINQQLILKEESYLDKMADVACGSFYIESITDAIAVKALGALKRFEKEGGYFECIKKGIFKSEIGEQARQREALFASKQQIAIGVNKFKNEKEKIRLSENDIQKLKQMHINNPVLNFELENYFQHA